MYKSLTPTILIGVLHMHVLCNSAPQWYTLMHVLECIIEYKCNLNIGLDCVILGSEQHHRRNKSAVCSKSTKVCEMFYAYILYMFIYRISSDHDIVLQLFGFPLKRKDFSVWLCVISEQHVRICESLISYVSVHEPVQIVYIIGLCEN